MESLIKKFKRLQKALEGLTKKLNVEEKSKELRELEAKSMKGDFWQDISSATATMERISLLKKETDEISQLKERLRSSLDLAGQKGVDETLKADLENETVEIETRLGKLEFNLFLSGKP